MPWPFSLTISGIILQPTLDPLARSDVSIGQISCYFSRATPKPPVGMPFRDHLGAHARARVIPAWVWRAESSIVMVLRGWEFNLAYHSSIPRTFCGLQVSRQISSRDRFNIAGVPRNSFRVLSPCILLPSDAFFGQVFKHNLRRTAPSERRSFGSVVKPRRRARARHPQARECRGGPPHLEVRLNRAWRPRTSCPRPISVGPSFFKQLWQVPEVGEAAAAGQHQGLGKSFLVH